MNYNISTATCTSSSKPTTTPSPYIKGLRLDRARRDLLDPRLAGRPISAIAYACEFGHLSGFNRAFKRAYAVSPKELRNASTSTAGPLSS